jgi:hypothetical protein
MPTSGDHGIGRAARVDGVLFLVLAPLAAHAVFSWIGFNPTDDGFVLAYGRRLLDGQVPHRDFIAIRPVGAALLHLPELLLGGEHVLAASRLVWWCELAFVAWIWVGLVGRALAVELGVVERAALRVLALVLAAHVAPPRAWHTVDGLAVASAGIALAWDARTRRKVAGYAIIGAAALCKQNFLVLAPIALVVRGDWRRPGCWLAAMAPAAFYAGVVGALGGGPDLAAQLGAQHGLVAAGIGPYVSTRVAVGLVLGALAGRLPRRTTDGRPRARAFAGLVAPLVVATAPVGLLIAAATASYAHYARVPAFVLFGLALGRTAALLAAGDRAAARIALLAVAVAWTSAISVGYPSPAYASGLLAALLLVLDRPVEARARGYARAGLVVLAGLACIGSGAARTRVVYRDRPAAELTRPLGDVLRGGAGIYTNDRTADFLADLNRAVMLAETRGRPYAILPDVPVHWVTARRPNPLPIDWPQSIELATPALAARVDDAIDRFRGTGVFLVQKVRADALATLALPFAADDPRYPVVGRVRDMLTKTGETTYFDVYE